MAPLISAQAMVPISPRRAISAMPSSASSWMKTNNSNSSTGSRHAMRTGYLNVISISTSLPSSLITAVNTSWWERAKNAGYGCSIATHSAAKITERRSIASSASATTIFNTTLPASGELWQHGRIVARSGSRFHSGDPSASSLKRQSSTAARNAAVSRHSKSNKETASGSSFRRGCRATWTWPKKSWSPAVSCSLTAAARTHTNNVPIAHGMSRRQSLYRIYRAFLRNPFNGSPVRHMPLFMHWTRKPARNCGRVAIKSRRGVTSAASRLRTAVSISQRTMAMSTASASRGGNNDEAFFVVFPRHDDFGDVDDIDFDRTNRPDPRSGLDDHPRGSAADVVDPFRRIHLAAEHGQAGFQAPVETQVGSAGRHNIVQQSINYYDIDGLQAAHTAQCVERFLRRR